LQPKHELGFKAAEILISRIHNKNKRPQRVVLDDELCVRDTSIAKSKKSVQI
jgi:DNA-binding LacI/PurR family transcriptional regulator